MIPKFLFDLLNILPNKVTKLTHEEDDLSYALKSTTKYNNPRGIDEPKEVASINHAQQI